jgi:hypothetical protein
MRKTPTFQLLPMKTNIENSNKLKDLLKIGTKQHTLGCQGSMSELEIITGITTRTEFQSSGWIP